MPEAEANACTPQGRIGTAAVSSSFASPDVGGEREPDVVAVGDLERVEQDLLDAVGLDVERLRLDDLAAAGVDRQPQRQPAPSTPWWWTSRREPGLVPLGERRRAS